MGTTIYGVLILDPPRHPPLELVKSSDADLAREAGILLRSMGGTSAVTPGRIRPADLQCIQPRRTRTAVSALHTHAGGQKCPRHT